MKLGLQLKLQLENVLEVVPRGKDFRWFVKVKCCNCGEISTWVYVTEEESVKLKGGRGHANLLIKCKICSRENSVDIIKDSVAPYTSDDSSTFKTIICFDCRGLEMVDFDPRNGFIVYGEERKNCFEDVNLSVKEWFDYDEFMQQQVSITELEFRFVKL